MWSPKVLEKIKELKKSILKKKIMLGFIIDSYSFMDKVYKYIHTIIAILTPIIATMQDLTSDPNVINKITIASSVLVAIMLKIKEYVTHERVRELSKTQTIKYTQLYERIDREILKPENKRQVDDDFIYWITREFQHIEMFDPELSYNEKKKFTALCKTKGIPIDDDMAALEILLHADEQKILHAEEQNQSSIGIVDNHGLVDSKLVDSNSKSVDSKLEDSNTPRPLTRNRSVSDEKSREEFKQSIKKMSPSADMQWTMERLNNLG
jgi:hypothetical protein